MTSSRKLSTSMGLKPLTDFSNSFSKMSFADNFKVVSLIASPLNYQTWNQYNCLSHQIVFFQYYKDFHRGIQVFDCKESGLLNRPPHRIRLLPRLCLK